VGGSFRVARTARERHDDRHVHRLRHADGLAEDLVVAAGEGDVRVQGIPVARECAHDEASVGRHPTNTGHAAGVAEQRIEIVEVIPTWPGASAQLDRLYVFQRAKPASPSLSRTTRRTPG
jgi:hypothetical protein